MMGRPTKYEPSMCDVVVREMSEGASKEEVAVFKTDKLEIMVGGSDFKSERELCDFIERNAENVAIDAFGEELQSYKREVNFLGRDSFSGRKPRVDFMFRLKNGQGVLVECKHPKSNAFHELSRSIGQILAYSALAEAHEVRIDRIAIFTTRYDYILGSVVRKFGLPVEIYVIGRKGIARYFYANET